MLASDALLLAGTIAVVMVGGSFAIAGVAKLGSGADTAETFRSLQVPRLLDRPFVHRTLPFGELALGVGLLIAPAGVWWPVALIAVLALGAMTALVARSVLHADGAMCNCFGAREPVTRRTVGRNIVLTALAVVPVLAGPAAPSPLLSAFGEQPLVASGVLLSAGLATLLTVLSRGAARVRLDAAETFESRLLRIPEVSATDGSGISTPIPALVEHGPVLLIHVKHGCVPCEAVVGRFADGGMIADAVAVRFLERTPRGGRSQSRPRLWDDRGAVAHALGLVSTPSAILLAADGTIPANPVYGTDEIELLVAGIVEAVERSRRSPAESVATGTNLGADNS